GFTVGIGIIIFLQQFPSLTGQSSEHTNVLLAAWDTVQKADPSYLIWSGGAIAIVALCMIVLPRLNSAIPASLVGVVIVSVLAVILPTPLGVIGELPAGLPAPTVPEFNLALLSDLLLPAFTVAALAGIESLLAVRVAASMADTGEYDLDRELVGQGL